MTWESLRYAWLRRVIVPVAGIIGVDACDRAATRLARGAAEFQPPVRVRVEARARDALNLSSDAAHRFSACVFEHWARFWVEAIFARRLLRSSSWRKCVTVCGEDRLAALARSRRGCILATAYHGNPAAAAVALGEIFRPVHVIADRLKHPILRAWQRDMYSFPNVRLIDPVESSRVVPELLAGGAGVMLICEGERPHGRAIPIDFLGRTLRCRPTLGVLAKSLDVPIAMFTCTRRPRPFRLELLLEEVIAPEAAEPDALTRQAMHVLENAILRRPEQYDWLMPTLLNALNDEQRAGPGVLRHANLPARDLGRGALAIPAAPPLHA